MMIPHGLVFGTVIPGTLNGQAFLFASLMMAAVGFITLVLLQRVPVSSWRLRSWLVAAVLLQGLMVIRSPIHLGLIERATVEPIVDANTVGQTWYPEPLGASAPDAGGAGNQSTPGVFQSEPAQSRVGDVILGINGWAVLTGLWGSVVLFIVAVSTWRYLRLLRLVRLLRPVPDSWRREWQALGKQSRIVGDVTRCEMLVSPSIGPLMVRRRAGYSLIVPEGYWCGLSPQQRRGVMLHELAHVERKDVWRQLLARVIATIHWFNPFAWWALQQYELAAESACDQRVAGEGKRAAAGFASALIDLVQWHTENRSEMGRHIDLCRGVGIQAMATPPLTARVSQLLKPNSRGDSPMKRSFLTLFTLALISVSFFQLRLTKAQEQPEPDELQLRVLSDQVAEQLSDVESKLDRTDPTTERFQLLVGSPSGKIAIAGYLNVLEGRSRDDARAEAIPRFAERHFTRDSGGAWTPRPESKPIMDRWIRQSERLTENIAKMKATMDDMAARMDTSTEAGGLFKRLLQDPQAPVAVLMFEMRGGGDVVSRYIAEALDKILVDRGDGNFTIVESKRQDAETQIKRFELANKISARLKRDLPILAAEYSSEDETHQELISYLRNPLTATIAAIQLAGDDPRGASEAVEKLHEHFEKASADTASGLKIVSEEAWPQLKEIYGRVDRAASILPRIQERLAEVAETMSADDPLAARLASQMKQEPIAVMLAAELPYAESDPGEELRTMLSEVMTSSGDKLTINRDREEAVTAKARELLQVCRKIRRHVGGVEEMLDEVADRQLVEQLGPAGRFVVLDQVRQFAERHRPDPIALMRDDLLADSGDGKLRVREDRREIVRRLVEESEKVQAEAGNDDF